MTSAFFAEEHELALSQYIDEMGSYLTELINFEFMKQLLK